MSDTSPDRRSLSTKKWVERRDEIEKTAALDDARVAEEAARRDELAQEGYHNPKGVWIGLAVGIVLILAGYWVVDTMRCDPMESDLALAGDKACR